MQNAVCLQASHFLVLIQNQAPSGCSCSNINTALKPCWQWASSVHISNPRSSSGSFFSVLFLEAAFDLAVSHSWTSVLQWCASSSSIYVLFCSNHQAAWQEKPQWPHHSFAAKVLCNTQLHTGAVTIFAIFCVFGAFPLFELSGSSDSGRSFKLWFQLVCNLFLWRLCPHIFEPVLNFAAEFLFCCVVLTVYSPSITRTPFLTRWNIPTLRAASVGERAKSGLWLVIDGTSAAHTLSAQLLSKLGQTWWLTSPWLFP